MLFLLFFIFIVLYVLFLNIEFFQDQKNVLFASDALKCTFHLLSLLLFLKYYILENQLFPEYKSAYYFHSKGKSESEKLYLRLLLVTDYICGMTDSYAKRLYQELTAIF